MPTPILYEDIQEEFAAMHLKGGLQEYVRWWRTWKRQVRIEAHQRYENHWRTKVSRLLHSIAKRIELPKSEVTL